MGHTVLCGYAAQGLILTDKCELEHLYPREKDPSIRPSQPAVGTTHKRRRHFFCRGGAKINSNMRMHSSITS